MSLNEKSPAHAEDFFDSLTRLADRVKLLCKIDVADFRGVMEWWGLTNDFAGVLRRCFCK